MNTHNNSDATPNSQPSTSTNPHTPTMNVDIAALTQYLQKNGTTPPTGAPLT